MIEGKWAKVGSIGLHRGMRCLAALLLSGSMIPGFALARTSQQPGSAAQLAQVKFIARGLTVQPPRGRAVKGEMNMPLFGHYGLQTGTGERASIGFHDGTILHMNQRTDAVLSSPHVTFVKDGVVDEAVAPGSNHRVQTAAAIAAAVGTNFLVKLVGGASYFMVIHGAVVVSNRYGSVVVKNNQGALVVPGQAPQPAYPVDATTATDWTRGMPTPNVGENIALDANGGYVAGYSSQHESTSRGASWDAPLLIDGQLSTGWETAKGKVRNQWVKIGFTGTGLFRITKVLIDPAATQGDPATADLKNFEIRISTSSLKASFTTVLRGTCRQGNYLQSFTLPKPVRVRFVELYALDNYGSRSRLAVAELEVVGTGGY
jgi:hypothetical protein